MYRTADEALYDSIVRPIIPYEPPVSWKLLKTEEQCIAVEEKKLCAQCLSPIVPFQEEFCIDEGQCVFVISGNSGLCRACFDALRANPPKYRPRPRTIVNYACGSESLTTISEEEI